MMVKPVYIAVVNLARCHQIEKPIIEGKRNDKKSKEEKRNRTKKKQKETNRTPPCIAFTKFLGSIAKAQINGAVPTAAERAKRALVLPDKSIFV